MRRSSLPLSGVALFLFLLSGCSGGSNSASTPTPTATPTPSPADNPGPAIASISPASVVAGSAAQTITIVGTGYIASTAVSLNGAALQTKYISTTTLQVMVPASALAAGEVASFVASNPSPGGGTSPAASFSIVSPTPVVASLSPQSVPQGVAATVTVNGSGFEANSVVMWNGAARQTTFVNSTTLQVALTATDLLSYGMGQITISNPGPGGTATTPTELVVAASGPTILSLSPSGAVVGTSSNVPTPVEISGSGFASNATVQANGESVPVSSQSGTAIGISLPASLFVSAGAIQIVVTNPGSPAVQSNPASLTVESPTLSFSIAPNSTAAGSPDTKIFVDGAGFFADSVVQWNQKPLDTTYVSPNELTAIIPAVLLGGFVQANIEVATPEVQGQTAPSQPFNTYLSLPVNDIVYNAADGLIYASVAGSAGEGLGNRIAAIDPNTGVILKTIFVGSEPNRIALSSDNTQLFVGLNGAGAVRQVNLTTDTAGVQFSLGGGPGVYDPPFVAEGLAVLPGQPNSVAVYGSNGVVSIFDSGVARPNSSSGLQTYFDQNQGSLAFGDSASTLYLSSFSASSYLYKLTVDATGVTAAAQLGNASGFGRALQYDNGRLYIPDGAVVDAATGNQLGQFSTPGSPSPASVVAAGPVVSDSTLGLAWVVPTSSLLNQNQILAFNESTFNSAGSLPVAGVTLSVSSEAADLIRWGQDGLAFHTSSQLYVVHGPIVKDVSSAPADLAVNIQTPATAPTGAAFRYTVQVANLGPNPAQGVTLNTVLPASTINGTVTPSQGNCSGDGVLYCDLGTIASGSSVNVTISVTPTEPASLMITAETASVSFDPVSSNNQATASTTVTGSDFNAAPTVTQLSPSLVPAGSSSITLTVDGTGFSSGSTVLWNGQNLPTAFVSEGQITATVDSSLMQQLGWAQVAVITSAPGGGQSAPLPLHIYQLLNVPANAISFDPFTRKLYAVLPSTSAPINGNSLVVIDPASGSIGSPIQVGSEPNLLSETSDGNYLYIGLSGAKSLGRFNLLTQTLDLTVPIISNSVYASGQVAASAIATVPGSDSSLAVELGYATGIGIIDINGSIGTIRKNLTQIYAGDNPVFADATHFYAYDSETTGAEFYRYSVDSNGATLIDGTTLNGFGGFGGQFALDGGLVFGSGGGIVNPATTPPSQLAVLPLGEGQFGAALVGGGVIPYQAESKAFILGVNDAGTAAYFLQRFDTQQYTLEQQIQLPGGSVSSVSGTRFGQDGLAYLLPSTATSQTPQIFLLRGPFVLPADSTVNAAPTLSSSSQNMIPAGSGNLSLTVTGTGFLPGAVVEWNGSQRTTTFIDNAHLQVAVPASDVANAHAVTLNSQNPGSGSSNNLSVTVQ